MKLLGVVSRTDPVVLGAAKDLSRDPKDSSASPQNEG